MSEKQEIYQELLRLSLPYIRSILSRTFVFGKQRKSAYVLSELIHNLYVSIYEPHFTEHDIWILNTQAPYYLKNAPKIDYYTEVQSLLNQLLSVVPESLKGKVTWSGN